MLRQKVIEAALYINRSAVRPNHLVFVAIALVTILFFVLGHTFHLAINFSLYRPMQLQVGPIALVLLLWLACIFTLIANRPQRPIQFIINQVFCVWNVPRLLIRGAPVLFLAPLPLSAYTSYKRSYSEIVPFYADPYLADIDRWIHTSDPWRVLQQWFGFPVVTYVLSNLYWLWFIYQLAILAVALFALRNDQLRSQYLTSFFLSWGLIGGVAATMLASVGPCYYSYFFGQGRFDDLMHYLRYADHLYPTGVLGAQAALLSKYQLAEGGFGVGISAFPSMHVAIVVLNALFISKLNRVAGYLAWIYALLIFVGSVHLGWHYAVDGYGAAILVYMVWRFSGWLSKMMLVSGFQRREEETMFGGADQRPTAGIL